MRLSSNSIAYFVVRSAVLIGVFSTKWVKSRINTALSVLIDQFL
jgi:hypothetical protein